MRKSVVLVIAVLTLAVAIPAFADLQNVIVGGSVRIRGNYWTGEGNGDNPWALNPLMQVSWPNFPWRIWPPYSSFRPGGNGLAGARWAAVPGRAAVTSPVSFNKSGMGLKFVEQLTKINVKADFTDQVAAFVEFDSYGIWGDNFRSNYITGVDSRVNATAPAGGANVSLRQSYVEANEIGGLPLRARVGRQDIKLGSGWLVGLNEAGSFFRGLSFDAVRLTYATDQFSVDAIAAKLAENALEEDGDTDMYAVYGSYLGIENITLDAYWIMVRDARKVANTNAGWFGEWVEDVLSVDNYDVTELHTVGLRGAGTYGALDFEAEAAYQFGNADTTNVLFSALGQISPYGPDRTKASNWAGNLMVGYTFDMDLKPRVFAGGAYYGGEDNRDLSFWQWLGAEACPFWHAKSSLSFNRLFSDWQYSNFVDVVNQDCSNLWLAYVGVSVMPLENLTVQLSGARVEALNAYDSPWSFWLLGRRITPFPWASFLTTSNPTDMCYDVSLKATYNYSADLSVEAGYSHMFVGDGAQKGNFVLNNGLTFVGGTAKDDPNYFYAETKLKF